MNGTFALRDVLFHELEVGVRTTKGLLEKIKSEDWGFRPIESMRTLLELANHLVQIPLADLAILQESTETEVHALYAGLESSDVGEMVEVLDKGFAALHDYMTSLSDEEFVTRSTKPFYLETGSTQAKWLVEIVTHFFHHRGQVFTYMKQLGYEINMFDLY